MLTLVTGATKSGKSEWAELLAIRAQQPVVYIATAQNDPEDREWQDRIKRHQDRRPPNWQTWKAPVLLPELLRRSGQLSEHTFLIDSLGTWVANLLEQSPADWQNSTDALLQALQLCKGTVIVVAEETGWGVVPAYASGRSFRDRLGHLTRQIGAIADRVYLVVAGYAIPLCLIGEKLPHP